MTSVLIADDDDISRELLAETLRDAGYEVCEAASGLEALAAMRDGDLRLVISDWDMPGLNGVELCRAVRAEEWNGYVYIILLTSHSGSEAIVEGMSAGADDFISKPFHPQELLARIRAGERVLSLETREMVIFALAKLAESRDVDTGHHLERVQIYSRMLAREMAKQPKFKKVIDGEFIRLVHQTSPLHDIGKVGIPDAVLLKPGKLTAAEYEVMKSHANLGAETLQAALDRYPEARFLRIARDIAAHHHERYDGKGYPDRLMGEQIPLCARIVALADVYDALTSKRVYKDAFTHQQAREIILKESGAHFDPDVVDAFLMTETEFQRVREELSNRAEDDRSALMINADRLSQTVACMV